MSGKEYVNKVIYEVEKRNGALVDFEASKIQKAIESAMMETIDGVNSELSKEISLKVQHEFELAKDIKVRLKATVVRSNDEGVAIDFDSMDESAFFHLRNMVRYSSEDADRIDDELHVPAFDVDREGGGS